MSINPDPNEIYTVSQLNLETRIFLEEAFGSIWIIGEISNLARPSSGHLYFSLKDKKAQIRCAFFRNSRRQIKFTPEDGQEVLIQANVSLYEPRGDFQLIVTRMELAGDGALQIAFEKLKQKLAAEGLFAEEHKKSIPIIPKKIGVVTSATGAAIRDILTVLKRRFASIPVVIYPTLVQGSQAAEQIVTAIKTANQRNECDVLIVARGGGSLEDLWPFNEEIVARAIFDSHIPIVAGIGHEVDFTIADFVADQRAATPSAAAEHVSPNQLDFQQQLNNFFQHFKKSIQTQLKHFHTHLIYLSKRLRHPGQHIREQKQRLDQIEQRLNFSIQNKLVFNHEKLKSLAFTLETVSPLKTLQRGYSIVSDKKTEKLIRSINDVRISETLNIKLVDGDVECNVKNIMSATE